MIENGEKGQPLSCDVTDGVTTQADQAGSNVDVLEGVSDRILQTTDRKQGNSGPPRETDAVISSNTGTTEAKTGKYNETFEECSHNDDASAQQKENANYLQKGLANYGLEKEVNGSENEQKEEERLEEGKSNKNEEKKKEGEIKSEKVFNSSKDKKSYTKVANEEDGRREEVSSSWFSWIKKELTWNKKLIPIKVIQFLYSGGTNSMLPYLTLHMQELGLTMKQIGVIYAFLPIATILGPPLSGMIADRSGNYKLVVLMNMILTTVLHVALLYIPAQTPNSVHFTCGESDTQNLIWKRCSDCHDQYQGTNFSLGLQNCIFDCDNPPSTAFEICFESYEGLDNFCRQFNVTDEILLNVTVSATKKDEVCGNSFTKVQFEEEVYQGISCPSTCPFKCEVNGVLPCYGPEGDENWNNVFWTYFAVRLVCTFFLSALFTMMDAMTIAIVKEHGGEYGKQRFLFILGMATIPLAAGFLNDWDDGSNGTSYYLPAIYLGAALCIAASALIATLKFKVEMAEDNILQDLKKLVVRPEINIYFLIVLILGSNWGFIESYLFLYMADLGSPNYLMGLTMTVGSIIGMPVMLVADKIVNKLGRHTIFFISFFAYTVRHFGYSFISSPWMVFPFELLEIFTYQLMWVAAVTYCPILAPPGLLATLTGVAGAVHFSVGRGVGSFIGGQLIAQLDIPRAFRCYGGIALGSGCIYILLHYCYLKKRIAAREEELQRSQKENLETEMAEQNYMVSENGERQKGESRDP